MIVIGISGTMSSGKSTAAKYIASKFKTATIIPFAKAVKDAATNLGWNGKKDEKGRRLLQLLGTECGRECLGENIWVNKWIGQVMQTYTEVLIADDVRFENEAAAIHEIDGNILQIYGRGPGKSEHRSEQGVDAWDYRLKNSGNMCSFEIGLDTYCEHLKERYNVK